ncbi:TMEM52 isoform 3, partial [Pongo abelii]
GGGWPPADSGCCCRSCRSCRCLRWVGRRSLAVQPARGGSVLGPRPSRAHPCPHRWRWASRTAAATPRTSARPRPAGAACGTWACMPRSLHPPTMKLSKWPSPERKGQHSPRNPVLSLGPQA